MGNHAQPRGKGFYDCCLLQRSPWFGHWSVVQTSLLMVLAPSKKVWTKPTLRRSLIFDCMVAAIPDHGCMEGEGACEGLGLSVI